jgi:hypothetical protein
VQGRAAIPVGGAGAVGNPGIPTGAPPRVAVPTPRPPTATAPAATIPVPAAPVVGLGALPASLPGTLRALTGRSSAAFLDLDAPDGAASDDPDMVMPAGAAA